MGRRSWQRFEAALVMALALVLASLPFVYGWAIRPAGTRFWAVPRVNSSDANQYLAFLRMARNGQLLMRDPFTTEPHPARLFLPLSLAEGWTARLTGLSPIAAYQVSRVLCGAWLLGAAWWFGTLLLPSRRLRRTYLGFLGFSGGAGWLLDRLGFPPVTGDHLQPEGNTFFMLGNLPHLALSAGLLTLLFGLFVAQRRGGNRRHLLAAFAASALLSWTHPFDFVPLALGLAAYLLIEKCVLRPRQRGQGSGVRGLGSGTDRKRPTADLRPESLPFTSTPHSPIPPFSHSARSYVAATAIGALPAAAYLVWLTRAEPVYRALAADSSHVHPFLYYAAAHGLLALAALPVLFRAWLRERYALPLAWVGAAYLFLLLPLPLGGKQGRVIGGLHAPLALLAAVGTHAAARGLGRRWRRSGVSRRLRRLAPLLPAGVLAVTSTGVYGMVERQCAVYAWRAESFYQGPGVQRLLGHLSTNARPGDVVVGGPFTGGWAPVAADVTSYSGHWHMTLDSNRKSGEVEWLLTSEASPREKADWLRRERVAWVVACPWEWAAPLRLDGVPGLAPVFGSPEGVLYRFRFEKPSRAR